MSTITPPEKPSEAPETNRATAESENSLRGIARGYVTRVRGGDVGSLPAILGLVVLIAVFSIRAHRRNQAANPGCRATCPAARRKAPVLPRACSAASTKDSSGMRRPNSTDATVCFENRTRSPNSSLLSPACSRRAWTTAPKVRRLSDDSGSAPSPT